MKPDSIPSMMIQNLLISQLHKASPPGNLAKRPCSSRKCEWSSTNVDERNNDEQHEKNGISNATGVEVCTRESRVVLI